MKALIIFLIISIASVPSFAIINPDVSTTTASPHYLFQQFKNKGNHYKVAGAGVIKEVIRSDVYKFLMVASKFEKEQSVGASIFRIYGELTGSSVLIGNEIIITNRHIVQQKDCSGIFIKLNPPYERENNIYCKKILYCGEGFNDFCLIQMKKFKGRALGETISPIELVIHDDLNSQAELTTIGHLGLYGIQAGSAVGSEYPADAVFTNPFLTNGSAKKSAPLDMLLYHQAPVLWGSSGGAVLNSQYQMVGLQFAQTEGKQLTSEGKNLAIRSSYILNQIPTEFLSQLNIVD